MLSLHKSQDGESQTLGYKFRGPLEQFVRVLSSVVTSNRVFPRYQQNNQRTVNDGMNYFLRWPTDRVQAKSSTGTELMRIALTARISWSYFRLCMALPTGCYPYFYYQLLECTIEAKLRMMREMGLAADELPIYPANKRPIAS